MDYHKDITQGSAFAKRYEIRVEHKMLILKAFSADTFIPVSKIFSQLQSMFSETLRQFSKPSAHYDVHNHFFDPNFC